MVSVRRHMIFFLGLLGIIFGATASFGEDDAEYPGTKQLTPAGADLILQHKWGTRIQAEFMTRRGEDNLADVASGVTADADAWSVQLSQRTFRRAHEFVNYVDFILQVDSVSGCPPSSSS